ncbi:MAG TPA: hypothetical protein VEA38_19210 [Terriglobales bacterium]|nr:hypothetical protein [Terriglobales bacterium]
MTAATPSHAAEPLPENTLIIIPPEGKYIAAPTELEEMGVRWIQLDVPMFLADRPEMEALVVLDADLEDCQQRLERCREDLRSTPPRPGYFQTPQGRGVVFGGYVLTVTAAFALGAIAGHRLSQQK